MSNRNVSNGRTILLSDTVDSTSGTIELDTQETQMAGGCTDPTRVVGGGCGATINPGCGGDTVLEDETETGAPRRRCVGWLLVISGPSCGCSREIYTGRNTVGRTSEIRIDGDAGVSGNQCVVAYDAEYNEYVLTNGSGHAITRVNGARVDNSVGLQRGDIIKLSAKTSLRFIPACDELFRW